MNYLTTYCTTYIIRIDLYCNNRHKFERFMIYWNRFRSDSRRNKVGEKYDLHVVDSVLLLIVKKRIKMNRYCCTYINTQQVLTPITYDIVGTCYYITGDFVVNAIDDNNYIVI